MGEAKPKAITVKALQEVLNLERWDVKGIPIWASYGNQQFLVTDVTGHADALVLVLTPVVPELEDAEVEEDHANMPTPFVVEEGKE
jgi:hypothetical protein